MLPVARGTLQALTSWRRSVAVALFALQAVIALSPMLERRDDVRRDSHIEALGSRHLFAHDEGTCLVCSARTLLGHAPTAPAALLVSMEGGRVGYAYAAVLQLTLVAPDNLSRAPPTLG